MHACTHVHTHIYSCQQASHTLSLQSSSGPEHFLLSHDGISSFLMFSSFSPLAPRPRPTFVSCPCVRNKRPATVDAGWCFQQAPASDTRLSFKRFRAACEGGSSIFVCRFNSTGRQLPLQVCICPPRIWRFSPCPRGFSPGSSLSDRGTGGQVNWWLSAALRGGCEGPRCGLSSGDTINNYPVSANRRAAGGGSAGRTTPSKEQHLVASVTRLFIHLVSFCSQ